MKYELANPKPNALIESLRAFGYNLKTAIADIIDNSITAESTEIHIKFNWEAKKSWIAIVDNGKGMSEKKLQNAMILGSENPLLEREEKDLGRFGLGLKTASFSQCRLLSVITKQNNSQSCRVWDLDYVGKTNEWRLLTDLKLETKQIFNKIDFFDKGTIVIWEKLDNIISDLDNCDLSKEIFYEKISEIENHLSMTFHRLLNKHKIFINNKKIKPWDPFLEKEIAHRQIFEEKILHKNFKYNVISHILPHYSKISKKSHDYGAGIRGWNDHQGFYVYRKKRLIVAGSWLNLNIKKEEHYKLARILIDIPSNADKDWLIDVKKSSIKPPDIIKKDLKRIANITRKQACEVYRHKGKVITRKSIGNELTVWIKKVKNDKIFFKINRKHPIIMKIFENRKETIFLKKLLSIIENAIPVEFISIESNENPNKIGNPYENSNNCEFLNDANDYLERLLEKGFDMEEALDKIKITEPFSEYPEIIALLREKKNV